MIKLFKDPADMLSNEAQDLLRGWGMRHSLITTTVEFGHRTAKGHAKAKGPAKPTDFRFISDDFLLSRLAVSHSHALGKHGSDRPRFRQHPQVQAVIKKVKGKCGPALPQSTTFSEHRGSIDC